MQVLKLSYKIVLFLLLQHGVFCRAAYSLPNRIVSLAPSMTEIVFALGAGDKLVGVTRYCDYPEKAKRISKVGGLYDPSFEAIVSLKPDLVILQKNVSDISSKLDQAGLANLSIVQETTNDILKSIEVIANALDKKEKGSKLINQLKNQITSYKAQSTGEKKVLIVIGKSVQSDLINRIFIVGKNTFYSELLELAGAKNAYAGESAYPQISYEGLITLAPDYIIDLAPEAKNVEDVKNLWHKLDQLSAIKNRHLHVLNESFLVHPGPRFILILEKFREILENNESKN